MRGREKGKKGKRKKGKKGTRKKGKKGKKGERKKGKKEEREKNVKKTNEKIDFVLLNERNITIASWLLLSLLLLSRL